MSKWTKLSVELTDCWQFNDRLPKKDRWLGSIKEMPGMVITGSSKQDCFDELMLSLRVKIIFDNNLTDLIVQ